MDKALSLFSAFCVLSLTWICAEFIGKGQKRIRPAVLTVQILVALLAAFSIVLLFFPAMPCEPIEIPLGRRGHAHVTVDTWNLVLPFLLPGLLFSVSISGYLIYRMTPAYQKKTERYERKRTKKKKWQKVDDEALTAGQKVGLSLIVLLFGAISALLIYILLTR